MTGQVRALPHPSQRAAPRRAAQPLPKSPEMEGAVLAGVLLKPSLLGTLSVTEADFTEERHRLTWRAYLAVRADGQKIDIRTVQARLEAWQVWESVGGMAYLAGLDLNMPDLGAVPEYARSLVSLRQRRTLILAGERYIQALYGGSDEDRQEAAREFDAAQLAYGSLGVRPVRLADVDPEPVTWLWYSWLPLAKLSLLEGDPGQGKSYLTAAIAAALSVGRGLGGSPDLFEPRRTLICSAEDGLADTLRPRLDLMDDANLDLIFAHPWAIDLSTLEGRRDLALAIGKVRPSLVVIDPLVAFVGGSTNTFRANEVRAVLEPLAEMAEEHRCAILAVRHLTKGQAGRSLYRGQGSIDFSAAARSVILAGSAGESDERAMVQIKNNLAACAPALGYAIAEDGRFLWNGSSGLTAEDLLSPTSGEERLASTEAADFLADLLSTGPLAAVDVLAEAKKAGICEQTLKRTKRRLGVRSVRKGFGKGACYFWQLPVDESTPKDDNDTQLQLPN